MRKFLTAATAALALTAATVAATTPAEARYYGGWHGGGYGYRGGWHGGYGGYAVGAGLLGLAAGVAIADRGYYGRPYGYGGYYAAYGPGYYGPGYYGRRCVRWDPYAGRYFRFC